MFGTIGPVAALTLGFTHLLYAVAGADLHKVGPWGSTGNVFDDKDMSWPSNAAQMRVTCRSHGRLDHLKVEYFDAWDTLVRTVSHGNPNGGDPPKPPLIIKSADDISGMFAIVCGRGKHQGKVCGIKYVMRDSSEYACGVVESRNGQQVDAQGFTDFEADRSKFHAFHGSTSPDGQIITSLGWYSEPK